MSSQIRSSVASTVPLAQQMVFTCENSVAQRQSCWGSNTFPRGGVQRNTRGSSQHSRNTQGTQLGATDPKQVRTHEERGTHPPGRPTHARTSIEPENQLWTRPPGGDGVGHYPTRRHPSESAEGFKGPSTSADSRSGLSTSRESGNLAQWQSGNPTRQSAT